jgi:UDPglucose 6-dehydrogenase
MENSFLATKVGLVAEFYELSRKLGLDWYAVREAWLADPRIGRAHSHALPHDLGFGGKCLPKDVAALCAFADSAGSPLGVLEAVRDTNRNRRSDIA